MPNQPRRERVLAVDDEAQILRALEDVLEDRFDIVTTTDPERALDLARADPGIAVVIADQRMPNMLGDEVLRRLRTFSTASAILLTGYADIEGVMRAVNDAHILGVLTKPWASDVLRGKVQQAAARFRLGRDLEEERQVVRDLMTCTPDAIYFTDREHRFTRVNDTLVKVSGVADSSELLGRRRGEVQKLFMAEELERQEDEIWEDGLPRRDVTSSVITSEGRRHFSTTKSPTRSPSGQIVGVLSISRDITARVEAEAALRASEERLRLAFQASKAGLFDWDMQTGRVSYSSAEIAQPGNTALGGDFNRLMEDSIHPADQPGLRAAVQVHLEARLPFKAMQVRTLSPDGAGYRWLELNAQAAWDDTGRPLRLVGSFLDVDDLRQAQARLVQAQKLEGIGQLAAGIAHEINTPSQYVTDNVAFLERAFAKLRSVLTAYQHAVEAQRKGQDCAEANAALDASIASTKLDYLLLQAPRALEQSREGLAHITSIVKAMKEFSHPGGGEKQLFDIHQIIESSSVVARNEWKYVAELSFDFDRDLPSVPVLRGELSQVLLNLIVNAAHAIAEAKLTEPERPGLIRITTCRVDGMAEIRIADTGLGIPEAIRARVFEPFFTTKEVGKGTGQGLAISHSVVVDKHRGSIHFESETGRGTSFVIRLPLRDEPRAAPH